MNDALFVGVFAVVMGVAFGYVRVCQRIVGRAGAPAESDSEP